MTRIESFHIQIREDRILKAVGSYYPLNQDAAFASEFQRLSVLVKKTIRPLGYFEIADFSGEISSDLLKGCRHIIYSIITIGEEITELIDSYNGQEQFVSSLLLDAISTQILFDISKQLNEKIYNYASSKRLGLTCRIAPGDGEIDIEFQRDIISKLSKEPGFEFSITDGYIVKPYKSLCYLFGADKALQIGHQDHECSHCRNLNCIMRDSAFRIRGPYEA